MISRGFGGDYKAACEGAPPPLHVTSGNPQGAWYPLPRIVLRPQPPGPQQIMIPVVAPFGDDPLDPTAQTVPRIGTSGMIGWLNAKPGSGSVRSGGSRA